MTEDLQDWLTQLEGMSDAQPTTSLADPDHRHGDVYRKSDDLVLALQVALATERPLLLLGAPGSGKSSLAAYVARNLGWACHEHVVTSRTDAQDLLWQQDHVERFAQASSGTSPQLETFVEPGVIWNALSPSADVETTPGAVVLIDEIDKAHPDVPNALLVPLGSYSFYCTPEAKTIQRSTIDNVPRPVLVIVTTNGERDLPAAFMRRCIVHNIQAHDLEALLDIAERHFKRLGQEFSSESKERATAIADVLLAAQGDSAAGKRPPSTAEYLDALFAAERLDVHPSHESWSRVLRMALTKIDPDRM